MSQAEPQDLTALLANPRVALAALNGSSLSSACWHLPFRPLTCVKRFPSPWTGQSCDLRIPPKSTDYR